jgi:hypothetical protein
MRDAELTAALGADMRHVVMPVALAAQHPERRLARHAADLAAAEPVAVADSAVAAVMPVAAVATAVAVADTGKSGVLHN